MGKLQSRLKTIFLLTVIALFFTVAYMMTLYMGSVEDRGVTGRSYIFYGRALKVLNIWFTRDLSADGSKMTVTMMFTLKNICDKQVIVKAIEVPEANFSKEVSIVLEPNQVYIGEILILESDYDIAWEKGTEHIAIFVYRVDLSIVVDKISALGRVR